MLTKEHIQKAKIDYANLVAKMMSELKAHEKIDSKTVVIDMSLSKKEIKEFLKGLSLNDKLGIYSFFAQPGEIDTIVSVIKDFRSEQKGSGLEKIRIAKPNEGAKSREGCIYIGMVNKDCLYKRLYSHFYGGKNTRSLKLSHWFQNTKISELKLCYIVFDDTTKHLIREYEKALWKYYEPCLGKL